MGFDFTEDQRRAINGRGGALLVSAAAGSGKTRVLTQRLMRYVSDPATPRDIDSFLVITYTRAAAAELRGRIFSELGKMAAENPLDRRLGRQQSLCCRAQIETIHSFCTDILRENAHTLGISPAFRVMDDDRAAVMKASCLENVLEKRYEKISENAAFRHLADTVGVGRDDSRLEGIVLALHEKLQSHPYPEDWAASQREAMFMSGETDAGESPWGRELLEFLRASVSYWSKKMDAAASDILSGEPKLQKAYGESFLHTAEAVRTLYKALGSGWDLSREAREIPFDRLGALRSPEDAETVRRVKAVREGCKKAAGTWARMLAEPSETLIRDMRFMAPAMSELLSLTLDFGRDFAREKRRQNFLDFSDLEHFALKLLVNPPDGAPTAAAREISRRYTEIMVDEYQDVNAVQDMLFRAVSRGETNLFMVGDVKQSIYRFRLSDPEIFLKKYERYADFETAEDASAGRRILLRENFRSRKSVLDAANTVFHSIMSKRLGEIEYDEASSLRYGALGYPEGTDEPAELAIIDLSGDGEDEERPDKAAAEAGYVAGRIRDMVACRTPVYENGAARPCRYSDFAVLLHAPKTNGGIYQRVLSECGVPVQSQQGTGFFSAPEISDMLNILAVIDNPHDDVTLIAALRSPLFGFTADELSEIRAFSREGCFYEALTKSAGSGNEKSAGFLSRLAVLRDKSPDMRVDALVWEIFDETQALAVFGADRGSECHGRLMLLLDYAGKFSSSGQYGLYRFVTWLRRLAERGQEPDMSVSPDAVRIMSIHKSKGLEFPFVFLSDLSHRFNRQDALSAVVMHETLGLGPKLTDAARGIEYPTLARRAIEKRMQKELLSEEMRVLYVAMTRAKERLIMTCVWQDAEKALDDMRPLLDDPLSPEILALAPSLSRWVAMAALLDGGKTIKMHIVKQNGTQPGQEAEKCADPAPAATEREKAELQRRLRFVYPFMAASALPTKLTATSLGEGREAAAVAESPDTAELFPEKKSRIFRSPEFGGGEAQDAAGRGTATHALLQYMELQKASSEDGVRAEAQRLADRGLITRQQADSAEIGLVAGFGRSGLCRRILAADEMRREFRFTLLSDAGSYFPGCEGEQILLQGVVDCFIVEGGEITVIDYKTDRVSRDGALERARDYEAQIKTYALSLGRICRKPVKQGLIYFLRPGVAVEVDLTSKKEK